MLHIMDADKDAKMQHVRVALRQPSQTANDSYISGQPQGKALAIFWWKTVRLRNMFTNINRHACANTVRKHLHLPLSMKLRQSC